MARTIQSPGVEINEIDLSLRPNLPIGTNILIPGFAAQGPLDEVLQVASLSEFEQIYGLPTNAQERYFYHTVKGAFQSQGNIHVSRLAYGVDLGDNRTDSYSALVYPVEAKTGLNGSPATAASAVLTINPSIIHDVTLLDGTVVGPEQLTLSDGTTSTTFTAVSGAATPGSTFSTASVASDGTGLGGVASSLSSSILASALSGAFTHTIDDNTLTLTHTTPGLAGNVQITTIHDGSGPAGIAHPTHFTGGAEAVTTPSSVDLDNPSVKNYIIGAPTSVTLTKAEYHKVKSGDVSWLSNTSQISSSSSSVDKIASGGIVVLNDKSLTVNEKFEGYYVGLIDNNDITPGQDYDSITGIKSLNRSHIGDTAVSNFVNINDNRLSFPLSSPGEESAAGDDSKTYQEGSLSEMVENLPSHDMSAAKNADGTDTSEYADALILGVFKIRKSTLDPDTEKLDYILTEFHIGSLNNNRETFEPGGGTAVSFGLENQTVNSKNFTLLVNTNISDSGDWVNREAGKNDAAILRSVDVKTDAKSLYPHGVYKPSHATGDSQRVGSIPSKLERVFEITDNHELFPLDITLEAGLGTIYAATEGGAHEKNYNDEEFFDLDPATSQKPEGSGLFSTGGQKSFDGDSPVMRYRAVANVFTEFAALKRKDHMCLLDPIRHIFVQGPNNKTLDDKTKNFSQHIYAPLKHLYSSTNNSYAATYGNWMLVFDGTLNRNIWVPPSGYIAAMYANTDSNFQPWFAPAGFTRGVLTGISDLAVYPKQKHRDQLYKINVNPIANFPNDGFVVFGQKTLQTKPSAFDRVNVRRLFLYLEKATRSTVKYFVFEPNTLFTRTQVANVLAPIFDTARNTQGLYDYLLICDERNNTPDVIDQNELVIDIYIKPVRAAEFILVNFYATRTGQDFSELVS